MDDNIYEELSTERKELQDKGLLPDFYTTGGYQLLKSKYLSEGETPKQRYKTIAKAAAKYLPDSKEWEKKFFDMMWKGWLSPSTPVLSNMGTNKGTPVSCSGQYIGDSVYEFYANQVEAAVLSQNGFGTSAYLGDIRPRGSVIKRGGKTSGVLPVLKDFVQLSNDISQGNNRRGSWAGYLPIDHGDFFEVADYLYHYPDSCNIGWIMTKEFKDRLDKGDEDAVKRYQRVMKIRSMLGKGYILKLWTANDLRPQVYKDLGLDIKASNLCEEIMLHSSKEYTYTCVLSSMNLYKYDEWKDTDAVFIATVFLDCVAEEFIQKARKIKGMEKAVAFTERGRALGLGVLGFHSYLQANGIPFESFEAHQVNTQIFKHMSEESLKASQWMAKELGEPDWCKGYGVRNTHRMAVAPTMSTALICGGVSQSIEPISMNVFNQTTAGGEVYRVSPALIDKMKERGVYNKETIKDIERNSGSVQHVSWLTDEEKPVFKTAFEIDQRSVLRLASTRQRYIDQGQSLNLFFDADEDEEYISEITQEAINDPYIIGLYYQRGMSGVKATRGECNACEG
jgi:ribonucleoside-diphosphate reductase alpha chain